MAVVLRGRHNLHFIVAIVGLAHHKASHAVAAANIEVAGAGRGPARTEAENAVGGVGLDVVLLVDAALVAELQLLVAQLLVQRDGQLTGSASLAIVAVGIDARRVTIAAGRVVAAANIERRRTDKAGVRKIGREAEFRQRIGNAAGGVIGVDVHGPARDAERGGQQKRGREGMGVVQREQVRVALVGAARAGIDEVVEAVERRVVIPRFGVLGAQQVVRAEAMIDLDVELIAAVARRA